MTIRSIAGSSGRASHTPAVTLGVCFSCQKFSRKSDHARPRTDHSPLDPAAHPGCAALGVTVRDMAREMGVAEKTIRRDLKRFQEARLPAGGNRRRARPQDLAARRRRAVCPR